jgi:hypothetical protein
VLSDWIHWLSALHPEQLRAFLIGLLLTDGPRYALSRIAFCLWDCGAGLWRGLWGRARRLEFRHCPSVCVILAGHNEADTIEATLGSVWGSYPRLEIIVVDDGSADAMAQLSQQFARTHAGVLVLSRSDRGGKSSAMNMALPYTRAEVVLVVDSDSHLGPAAIWEMVQPFRDPRVGAVSGTVLARNPFTGLATWTQAYEYLSSIFVGRLIAARLGILGIVSGAFGAFRREVLDRCRGWDAGPPEDLDLTLFIRKAGYRIAFAPYAECYTEGAGDVAGPRPPAPALGPRRRHPQPLPQAPRPGVPLARQLPAVEPLPAAGELVLQPLLPVRHLRLGRLVLLEVGPFVVEGVADALPLLYRF